MISYIWFTDKLCDCSYLAERITQVVRKIRREMEEKRMREKELAQKRRIKILRRMFRM